MMMMIMTRATDSYASKKLVLRLSRGP